MRAALLLLALLLPLGLVGCDSVFGSKDNVTTDEIFDEGAVDPTLLDEVGYVPFAQLGAELVFQIISERVEKASFIITTNLPFSEWTQVFPSARLCKALLDRITDRAHIIDTGSESYRFKRTVAAKQRRGPGANP